MSTPLADIWTHAPWWIGLGLLGLLMIPLLWELEKIAKNTTAMFKSLEEIRDAIDSATDDDEYMPGALTASLGNLRQLVKNTAEMLEALEKIESKLAK